MKLERKKSLNEAVNVKGIWLIRYWDEDWVTLVAIDPLMMQVRRRIRLRRVWKTMNSTEKDFSERGAELGAAHVIGVKLSVVQQDSGGRLALVGTQSEETYALMATFRTELQGDI
ncbi:unnamed protein product [Nippostrongylus brasiliensis]|uniref:Transposase n=1 Tax=Nippostrongylus brasiliensis TaxID=27835 RepID=A0A0N4Y191_NIPBR|nr:unnamed protein product [Nippostrongylus brasiliensis]